MTQQLRVWHIPQIPGKPFLVHVTSIYEAVKVMGILANYDIFQYDNNIKGDYANAQGLSEYVENYDGEDNSGWLDWCTEDGEDDPKQWVLDHPESTT